MSYGKTSACDLNKNENFPLTSPNIKEKLLVFFFLVKLQDFLCPPNSVQFTCGDGFSVGLQSLYNLTVHLGPRPQCSDPSQLPLEQGVLQREDVTVQPGI